jgi:hypothetical protein
MAAITENTKKMMTQLNISYLLAKIAATDLGRFTVRPLLNGA